jgi:hypothetical protein
MDIKTVQDLFLEGIIGPHYVAAWVTSGEVRFLSRKPLIKALHNLPGAGDSAVIDDMVYDYDKVSTDQAIAFLTQEDLIGFLHRLSDLSQEYTYTPAIIWTVHV